MFSLIRWLMGRDIDERFAKIKASLIDFNNESFMAGILYERQNTNKMLEREKDIAYENGYKAGLQKSQDEWQWWV